MDTKIETPLPRPMMFNNICRGALVVYYSRLTTDSPRVYIKTATSRMISLHNGEEYPVSDIRDPKFVRVTIRSAKIVIDQ